MLFELASKAQSAKMSETASVDSIWQNLKESQTRPRSLRASDRVHSASCSGMKALQLRDMGFSLKLVATGPAASPSIQSLLSALASPTASRRRAALQQLQETVGGQPLSLSEAQGIGKEVTALLADGAASCREESALLLAAVLEACQDSAAELVPYFLPVVHSRLVRQEQGPDEQSEEARVALLGLLVCIIKVFPQGAFDNGDKVLDILASALADSCPGVNLLGCSTLCSLAGGHGSALAAVSKQLVACAMPLLTHRMQKVRVAAIQAVRLLVPWGAHELILNLAGFKDPNVIPAAEFYEPTVYVNYFGKLAMDSSIKVRTEFVGMVGFWMCVLRERQEHEGRLLPYVLGALNDVSALVADAAWQLLTAIGKVHEQDNAAEIQDILDFSPPETGEHAAALRWLYGGAGRHMLPAGMQHRLGLGARLLTQRCLGLLIPALAAEMTGWKEAEAEKAAVMLRSCAVLAEDTMRDHLPILLPSLCKIVPNQAIRATMRHVAEVIGAFVPAHDYLQWLLPMLCKPGSTSDSSAAVLQILASTLAGAGHRQAHDKDCAAAVTASLRAAGLEHTRDPRLIHPVQAITSALALTREPLICTDE